MMSRATSARRPAMARTRSSIADSKLVASSASPTRSTDHPSRRVLRSRRWSLACPSSVRCSGMGIDFDDHPYRRNREVESCRAVAAQPRSDLALDVVDATAHQRGVDALLPFGFSRLARQAVGEHPLESAHPRSTAGVEALGDAKHRVRRAPAVAEGVLNGRRQGFVGQVTRQVDERARRAGETNAVAPPHDVGVVEHRRPVGSDPRLAARLAV